MNRYLISGLVIGALCALAYICFAIHKKQRPILADVVQVILSGIGISSGIKIAWFVVSGQFSNIIKTYSQPQLLTISEDDTTYFFIGGIALIWVSLETIANQFTKLSSIRVTESALTQNTTENVLPTSNTPN